MGAVLADSSGYSFAPTARPWDVVMTRLRQSRLDNDLASGTPPDSSLLLALRARSLVAVAERRQLARRLGRVRAKALHGPAGQRLRVPICTDQVRSCSTDFEELIGRLLAADPVSARGVALTRALLTDGSGPLFMRASAQDLQAAVRTAAEALDS
jgi:hypothetical protein